MPDYSFNWTARSGTIQGWQRCQWCSSPIQRWPSRNQSVFVRRCLLAFKPTANYHPSVLSPGAYITKGTGQIFIPLMRFMLQSLISEVFFHIIPSSRLVWWCPLSIYPSICNFPSLRALYIIIILLVGFHTSFSRPIFMESEWQHVSSLVSRTLNIQANLNNIVIWMVSIRPPISNSYGPLSKIFRTDPIAPITTGIIFTFLFHSFLFF